MKSMTAWMMSILRQFHSSSPALLAGTHVRAVGTHCMKFILPLALTLPRKTKKDRRVALNLNEYRNWQFHLSNDLKVRFCALMESQMKGVVLPHPVVLTFTLFKKDKRIGDRANVLSVVEKFACDSLVHHGCLPDDNDNFIIESHYKSGGIDKENPRVEMVVEPYLNK